MTHHINVAGIPLYCKPMNQAVEEVVKVSAGAGPATPDEMKSADDSSSRKNRCISATGAHGIVHARKDSDFAEILRSYHINLPDGVPGVWVGRLKGAKQMERCYGPDFFAEVMRASADLPVRHFLCGGADGVAGKLAEACRKKFGNDQICGTYTPPFLPAAEFDYEEIARRIGQVRADIVWIGLGAPKQEEFAWRLAQHTDVHYLVAVGAAFDFHTGRLSQAPRWMQRAGLEWFYRLMSEPGRLWRRYGEVVPKFIWYAAGDLLVKNPDSD